MITDVSPRMAYTCDGSTVAFAFAFRLLQTADLYVYTRVIATGVQALLTEGVDYTVSAANNDYTSGGTVTTTATYASTYQLVLVRRTSLTQETDYTDGSAFPANSHELALDKLTMIAQELQEQLERVPMNQATDFASGTTDMTLPDRIDRASLAFTFDADGNPTAT